VTGEAAAQLGIGDRPAHRLVDRCRRDARASRREVERTNGVVIADACFAECAAGQEEKRLPDVAGAERPRQWRRARRVSSRTE
jgi:hypothetical protein